MGHGAEKRRAQGAELRERKDERERMSFRLSAEREGRSRKLMNDQHRLPGGESSGVGSNITTPSPVPGSTPPLKRRGKYVLINPASVPGYEICLILLEIRIDVLSICLPLEIL
ncbi:MAG: hypothetical protein V2I37_06755 [Marinilabiliaceae bacterium]|jgi:hypothetical protein|nr:hypothetical protein [Marinilabiliaceae bacterium]